MEAREEQRRFLFLEERTWDVLLTLSFLLIGLVGLRDLVIRGETRWLALIALALGIARAVGYIRRWRAA